MPDVYVDNVLGLDTNTGLSWIQAYKTISKAVSATSAVAAGDDVIVRRNAGNPYLMVTDEGGAIDFGKSGTSGNPITILPEFPGLAKVLIDTEAGLTSDVFDTDSQSYWDIEEFEIDGTNLTGQMASGIEVTDCGYINIRRCYIHDIDTDSGAVDGSKTPQTPASNNILIEDCEFENIFDSISSTSSAIVFGGGSVNNITIRRCTLDGLVDEGIKFQWQDAASDQNTILIEDCSFDATVDGFDVNLKQCRDVIVRNCSFGASETAAIGIDGSYNVLIEDSKFNQVNGKGIHMVGGTFGAKTFRNGNIVIQRCEFFKIGFGGNEDYPRAVDMEWLTDDYGVAVKILNCTIDNTITNVGGGDALQIDLVFDGTGTSECEGDIVIHIYNNNITNSGALGIDLTGSGNPTDYGESVTILNDYNNFHGNTGADIDAVPTGWTMANNTTPEPNGLATDPLYMDQANGNLRLQPSSSCIGAGDPALPSLHGSAPDIGSREYGAPLTRPNGNAARMRHGKYYRGPTGNPELLTLERMER